jgi:1-acyl-sn-glycerol-3-phosphate acyltransferase
MATKDVNGPTFTLHRRPWLLALARPLLHLVAGYHRLEVQGGEFLPQRGPALLLVKHRATRDSLLLSHLVRRHAGRDANFLAKYGAAGLPLPLVEALGGVPVLRAKDVLRAGDRAARRAALERARAHNRRALDYVAWLYERGELVVAYPEGMFYPNRLGPLDTGAITQAHTLARQRFPLSIIPLGTEYETSRGLRPKVWFRVGTPLDPREFASVPPLVRELEGQLRRLSNLR